MLVEIVKAILVGKFHVVVVLLVIERNGYQIFLLISGVLIGYVLSGKFVTEYPAPVHVSEERIYFFHLIAKRIQTSDKSADAGAENHIDGYVEFFQIPERTHVRRAFRSASAEHQSHSRTMLPDLVHPLTHPDNGYRIPLRVKRPCWERRRDEECCGKGRYEKSQLFHLSSC